MLLRTPHLFIYKINNNLKMRTLHLEPETEKDIIGVEDYTIVENKIIVTRYLGYNINYSIENSTILKLLLNDKKELAIKMIDLLYTEDLEAIKQQIIISKRPKTYNKKTTVKQESLKDVLLKYFIKFDKFPNECDATIDNLFSLDHFKTNEKYKKYKTFIENCRTIKPFIYEKMTYQNATDLYYKKYLNQLKKNPNKNK